MRIVLYVKMREGEYVVKRGIERDERLVHVLICMGNDNSWREYQLIYMPPRAVQYGRSAYIYMYTVGYVAE